MKAVFFIVLIIYNMMSVYCFVMEIFQAPYLFDESVHVMKFASIAYKITTEQVEVSIAIDIPALQP